ncbi:MAG TPA: DUF1549 domain-containing protein [Planctomycetaceae bacterium]|nr:DUF1549 domain-containing protein [Planctomycetaceae bacterium]
MSRTLDRETTRWSLFTLAAGVGVVLSSAGVTGARAEGGDRGGQDGSGDPSYGVPLHERIDRLVEGSAPGPLAALCSDEEFLRRASLTLIGTVPPPAEARAFLDDASPDKRTALIDRLLADARHPLYMAGVFDVMLMERRPDQQVPAADWQKYLQDSFAANKPWDVLAREILASDGADAKLRAPAKFFLDRPEVNLLTRDVGRILFGMDLQCAQCHDHPLIDNYKQSDYFGLYAFVNRSYNFADPQLKLQVVAEKGEGDVSFKSVFTGEAGDTRPRLPGDVELDEPTFARGEEYTVKPADNVRPIPKYSRRQRLATEATNGTNRAFNRNIANRLWAHMMGRGLAEPVDLHHPENPPSHPEVLDLLADEFVAMKYDIRALLRELALTRTYQRSVEMPLELLAAVPSAAEQVAQLKAEYERLGEVASESTAASEKLKEAFDAAKKSVSDLNAELDKAHATVAETRKAQEPAAATLAQTEQQLAARRDVAGLLGEAASKAADAAARLSDDKELAAAVEPLKNRSVQLAAEVTALEQTHAQHQQAAMAAREAVAAAEKGVAEITARLEAARPPLTAADREFTAADVRRKEQETLSRVAQLRVETLEALAGYGSLEAKAMASTAAAEPALAELAPLRTKSAEYAAQLLQREAVLAGLQPRYDAVTAALAETRAQFSVRQEVAALFAAAAASTDLALKELPEDEALKDALATLSSRSQAFSSEVAELQKAAGQREAELQAITADREAAQQALATVKSELDGVSQQLQPLEEKHAAVLKQAGDDRAAADEAFGEITEHWTIRFTAAPLQQLSPEQLAWATLEATGMTDRQRAGSQAELDQKDPAGKQAAEADSAARAARLAQIEQDAWHKLKGNVGAFVNLFGGAAGEPQHVFYATVDQALFFSNGGTVRGWIAGGTLLERLSKLEQPAAVAEELYLSVLTRRPSESEIADVAAYLESRKDERPAALQELAWALLSSTEFRFNH